MNSYSSLSALVMGSLLLVPPVGAAPVVWSKATGVRSLPLLHAMKPQQPVCGARQRDCALLQQDKSCRS
ncbi:MAG: hypothetical protein U0787_09755 [Polyangia bacterium]